MDSFRTKSELWGCPQSKPITSERVTGKCPSRQEGPPAKEAELKMANRSTSCLDCSLQTALVGFVPRYSHTDRGGTDPADKALCVTLPLSSSLSPLINPLRGYFRIVYLPCGKPCERDLSGVALF